MAQAKENGDIELCRFAGEARKPRQCPAILLEQVIQSSSRGLGKHEMSQYKAIN